MEEKIFRKKSIDRVSSPEDLNHYIKSTSPSVWFVLAAIIVLLAGFIVWAAVGTINSGGVCGVEVKNGEFTCVVDENTYKKAKENPLVKINDEEINSFSVSKPTDLYDENNQYLLHISNISEGEWYYVLKGKTSQEDGQYQGYFIAEKISPITFIFN